MDLFNCHGYDATSMGMLAAHLGISTSAIYHHVDSKEAILGHALDDALAALEAALDDVASSGGPAGSQVEAAIRGGLGVLVEKMPEVTLLLRLRGNSEVEREAMERRRSVTRRLGQMIEAAQAEGSVRTDVAPRNLARLALGMINSIVDWYRPDGADPGPPSSFAKRTACPARPCAMWSAPQPAGSAAATRCRIPTSSPPPVAPASDASRRRFSTYWRRPSSTCAVLMRTSAPSGPGIRFS